MQIELINTFLDLCETHSFNRTADRMGLTQSTVSARVERLEGLLNSRLFARSRSGTELTTAGLRFEPHARALRLTWSEALNAVQEAGQMAITFRIGIQHDLGKSHIGAWVSDFRNLMPQAALYVEPDFSIQMCNDLVSGRLDLAMMFTPQTHPDLHFEPIGQIKYLMVSTQGDQLTYVTEETYIRGNFSPAFSRLHSELLPNLSASPVASGQSEAVAGLLSALGGTAYLTETDARRLVQQGNCQVVADAPEVPQEVYSAVHIRDRHRTAHTRLVRHLRTYFKQRD